MDYFRRLDHIPSMTPLEKWTLVIAGYGASMATFAVLGQLLSVYRDRSRLKVWAGMSFGTRKGFMSDEPRLLIDLRLTNRGRRIVRIESMALRIHNPIAVWWSYKLFNRRLVKLPLQEEVGFYRAQMDPIEDFGKRDDVDTYPPKQISLAEHESISLTLRFLLTKYIKDPKRRRKIVITDHLGHKYTTKFHPLAMTLAVDSDAPDAPNDSS